MEQNAVLTLAQLPENRSARISALRLSGGMRRRLRELGFIAGTRIICLHRVSDGAAAAYLGPRHGHCPAAERCRAHRGAAMKDAGSAVALMGNPKRRKVHGLQRADRRTTAHGQLERKDGLARGGTHHRRKYHAHRPSGYLFAARAFAGGSARTRIPNLRRCAGRHSCRRRRLPPAQSCSGPAGARGAAARRSLPESDG